MKKPHLKTGALLTVLLSCLMITCFQPGSTGMLPWALAMPRAVVALALPPAQIEAGVEEYFASIGALEAQRFAKNFAPDAVLEDPVGTPPIQGKQAIRDYFARTIAPFREIKPKVQGIIICGNEATVNWQLRLKTTTGKQITIDGVGIFKFNLTGKLNTGYAWRPRPTG